MKEYASGPYFAIKIIDQKEVIKKLNDDKERFNQMRGREMDISYKVSGIKYCIQLFHEFTEDDKDYFVYELCSGGDL